MTPKEKLIKMVAKIIERHYFEMGQSSPTRRVLAEAIIDMLKLEVVDNETANFVNLAFPTSFKVTLPPELKELISNKLVINIDNL